MWTVSHMAAYIMHTTVELPFAGLERMFNQRPPSDLHKDSPKVISEKNDLRDNNNDDLESVTSSSGASQDERSSQNSSLKIEAKHLAKPFLVTQRHHYVYQTQNTQNGGTGRQGEAGTPHQMLPGSFDSARVAKYRF